MYAATTIMKRERVADLSELTEEIQQLRAALRDRDKTIAELRRQLEQQAVDMPPPPPPTPADTAATLQL